MQISKGHSKNLFIVAISSDIGIALASSRLEKGWNVYGTYRKMSRDVEKLVELGAKVVELDLLNEGFNDQLTKFSGLAKKWDELIIASGTLSPVEWFEQSDPISWNTALEVNFLKPIEIIRTMLPKRGQRPLVLCFSGSGSNGIAPCLSAYTVGKIGLIKTMELLDSEIDDTRFCIVGPGWVKTKIHEQAMVRGRTPDTIYQKTKDRHKKDQFVPMADVIACVDWISSMEKSVIGGRNISVAFDNWRAPEFKNFLSGNPNAGKIRRYQNEELNQITEAGS